MRGVVRTANYTTVRYTPDTMEPREARRILFAVILSAAAAGFGAHALAAAPAAVAQHEATLLSSVGSSNQDAALLGLQGAGYAVLFIALIIEGALVTAAASFAAALGYFNIWIVFILAVLGDVIADAGYYGIGYWSRSAVVERYGHRFGLTPERLQKFETLLRTHPVKSLLFVKLAPISAPGLVVVGASRMPFVRFITLCALIILPKVIFFMALGYFFGAAYETAVRYAQTGEYLILLAVIVIAAAYWGFRKFSASLARRIDPR